MKRRLGLPEGMTLFAVANVGGKPVVYGVLSTQIWDLTRSKPLTPLREAPSATRMALHPRTPLMALNDGMVLELPTGRLMRDRTERDLGDAMAYDGSGDLLAVADGSGRILLYDGAMRSPRGVLAGGEPEGPDGTPVAVTALAFSPDGRTLGAGTRAGSIRLWDIPSRTMIGTPLPTSGDRVRTLAFSPDGESLHIQGSNTRPAPNQSPPIGWSPNCAPASAPSLPPNGRPTFLMRSTGPPVEPSAPRPADSARPVRAGLRSLHGLTSERDGRAP
ncbi:WD40 repeat domain-containing protein [Streptomyces sp. NPDC056549]|uniref:WD40 repeat domain-containing protein n=1 Tax=Streptomyces sp. NPDC056549 TaxID=3345864 RepID=UPI0036BEEFAA